jgi:carbon-monoxide dehydrogenase medium subunit
MIPAEFEYARASSIDDAITRLKASDGAGKLIAGGHSLVPMMKLRLAQPSLLIDVARIPGLAGIREHDGAIEVGAATVHHDVASSTLLRDRCPMLAETAAEIGDPQVRNRGTLGGSLAHADPASDYPAAMLALDAQIHVQGPQGARQIAASAFFQDLFTVDLRPDEIIVAVRFAPVGAADYAIVGVAVALDVAGGTIRSARVGLTGAGSHAIRLTGVEEALAGQPASTTTIAAAAGRAASGVSNVSADLHASADYRRAMITVFTKRALDAALRRA